MEKLLFNKKGLSTIVTTLIIVLLVLVAVGIVWLVVSNVIDEGVANIDYNSKCLGVDLSFSNVVEPDPVNSPGFYDISVTRGSGGDDISGVKAIFTDADNTQNFVSTTTENIEPLGIQTIPDIPIGNLAFTVSKIEIAPYFIDDSGEEHICAVTDSYEFS